MSAQDFLFFFFFWGGGGVVFYWVSFFSDFFPSLQISCWVSDRLLSNTMFAYLQRGYRMYKSECWLRCSVCMSEFSNDLSITAKHSKLGFWIIIIFTRKEKRRKRNWTKSCWYNYLLLLLMYFIIHVVVQNIQTFPLSFW